MSAPVRESKTSLPPWTRRSFRSDNALGNLQRTTRLNLSPPVICRAVAVAAVFFGVTLFNSLCVEGGHAAASTRRPAWPNKSSCDPRAHRYRARRRRNKKATAPCERLGRRSKWQRRPWDECANQEQPGIRDSGSATRRGWPLVIWRENHQDLYGRTR